MKKIILSLLSLLFLDVSVEAFTLISNDGKIARWRNGQVSYFFNSGVPNEKREILRNSFATWLNVPGISLTMQELSGAADGGGNPEDRKNEILWVLNGWRSLDFRPPSNALAVTLLSFDSGSGEILDADIFFNAETFTWADVDATGSIESFDVQNIATHEIGHLLGLDHSSEDFFEDDSVLLDATMYYASAPGESARRYLNADDRTGLLSLYGAAESPVPAVSAVSEVSRSGSEVKYSVTGQNFSDQTSFVVTSPTSSLDKVARYKAIQSSTSAEITIDLGRTNGAAQLVAYNGPSAMTTFSFSVAGATANSNSQSFGGNSEEASGGGGCALHAGASSHQFSWVSFYFLFLSGISVALARRRFQRGGRKLKWDDEF